MVSSWRAARARAALVPVDRGGGAGVNSSRLSHMGTQHAAAGLFAACGVVHSRPTCTHDREYRDCTAFRRRAVADTSAESARLPPLVASRVGGGYPGRDIDARGLGTR